METGTIKKIMAEKGFGFIKPDDGSDDLFVHHSDFTGDFNSLGEGAKVTFKKGMGDKGPKATEVAIAA